ncbi:MAG: hypothetical protein ACI4WH_06925 [Oscillospiraceae bacterium]
MKLQKILQIAVLIIVGVVILKLAFVLLNMVLSTASVILVALIKLVPVAVVIFFLVKVIKKILKK